MKTLVILGSGPAGLTAAIYAGRAGLSPLVLDGPAPGGPLITTPEIENIPGFPDGIAGYDFMDLLRRQAEKFGARFQSVRVDGFTPRPGGGAELQLDDGTQLTADAVIIATGANHRHLGLPNERELAGHGLSYCATCDGAFYRNQPIAVVGGGDTAMEEALFLTRFASQLTLIHRRDAFRASKIMAERTLSNEKIFPMWNSTIVSYKTDDKGELEAVMLKDVVEGDETELPVKCVFMAIGHTPNTSFLGDLVDRDDAGYIIRETGMMATRTPGLFAAGDVADPHYRQAISSAGMGCSAAIEAERYLLGL